LKPRYAAVVIFVVILAVTSVTDAFARDAHLSNVRSGITAEADALARNISDVIARETAAVDTLAAFVEITRDHPTRMASDFPIFAAALIDSAETIRSVQLAPDSIIRLVAPLEGNEEAVDLDLLADLDRKALLEPAIRDGTTVVQGPVELVQGGLGILVRSPIYNDDGSYWGLAAILLDWHSVAALTDLDDPGKNVIAAARLPESEHVLAGDEAAFDGEPIIRTVRIGATDTTWEIAVQPSAGWPSGAKETPLIWIAGVLLGLVSAIAAYAFAKRPEALRQERAKALRELAAAEARYQAVFEHAGLGIAITDTSGRFLSLNPAINTLTGRSDITLEGTVATDLVHPDDRQSHNALVQQLYFGNTDVVMSEVRIDGAENRWVRINMTMIDRDDEQLFVSTVEDVTDRREAEAALADSESRFRQLFEQAPIAIQREDHSSVIEEFARLRSEGVTDIREYLEASNQATREILAGVRIVDANPAARELQGHLEQSEGQLTLLDRYTDPSIDTFVETLAAIWEGKTSLDQSVETIAPDGSARFLDLRWYVPLVDGQPDYSRVMVTIADITELREAQRRLEDLIESKDRFLASVAHELRTPLTAVVGFAQELKDDLQLYGEPEKEEFRELIAFHSAEISHIIEDLLVWAREDVGEVRVNPERIDLADAVRRSVQAIPGLSIEVTEPDGKVEAFADPARLRQIVRNLTTNAVRYGGSDVSVQVRRVNGEACVEVMDDGPRMDSADMSRIFEPYTRSDAVTAAPGSIGLGLTVSRSLARLQDGDLVCVREGTYNVFRVTLPPAPDRMLTDTSA
jgi:two-component system sensor histidine kinase/response regulator